MRVACGLIGLLCLTSGCGSSHDPMTADAGALDAAALDCVELRRAHSEAFEAAVFCDPSTDECTGAREIRSSCGCLWAANDANGGEASTAESTWEALSSAGCVPTTCGACPAEPGTFSCQVLPVGTSGTCERR